MKKRIISIFLIVSFIVSMVAVSAVSSSALTTNLAPPMLGKVSNYNGFININWSRVSGAEQYCMWYRINDKGKWYGVYTTKNYWNIQHPVPGTKFTIKISAVDYWGEHSAKYSNDKIIRYVNPPKITSVMQCNNGFVINWTNIGIADKYCLFYRYRDSKNKKWSSWSSAYITRDKYNIFYDKNSHRYMCEFKWKKLKRCYYFEIKVCAKAYGYLSAYSNLYSQWHG